jgi:purine-binding chemotaxis protein CheW
MEDLVQALRDEYWRSLETERDAKRPDLEQYVSFRVTGQDYGIPIGQVREVTLVPGISRLPRSPDQLAGVINLRGRIVPILDLRPLLGVPDREIQEDYRILIVHGAGQEVGIIAEKVHGILEVDPDDLRLRPPADRALQDPFLRGQVETPRGITIIVDAEELIEGESTRLEGEGA